MSRLAGDVAGTTAIEYAIITSIITIGILISLDIIGTSLVGFFQALLPYL